MKYNIIDLINIFLFIILIIVLINKITSIENFKNCGSYCNNDYTCDLGFYCDYNINKCCKD